MCNQITSHHITSNQIKSNQIKSNQIKSNQIKSNQIKSNQIKSNHCAPSRGGRPRCHTALRALATPPLKMKNIAFTQPQYKATSSNETNITLGMLFQGLERHVVSENRMAKCTRDRNGIVYKGPKWHSVVENRMVYRKRNGIVKKGTEALASSPCSPSRILKIVSTDCESLCVIVALSPRCMHSHGQLWLGVHSQAADCT
jgi:hypothetical protein